MPLQSPIYLVASGDSRLAANQTCWEAQDKLEKALGKALQSLGYAVERAHPYDAEKKHGFIDSQRMGMKVFASLPSPNVPLIVAEAVWQYSHHVLAGLTTHQGPILTVANWSGQWPGLVGMLNLNGSLTKAGVKYSTLWSADFTDDFFMKKLQQWLETGTIEHDVSHARLLKECQALPSDLEQIGKKIAEHISKNKAIMGVFDEVCSEFSSIVRKIHFMVSLRVVWACTMRLFRMNYSINWAFSKNGSVNRLCSMKCNKHQMKRQNKSTRG